MLSLKVSELLQKQDKSMYWLAKQTGIAANNIGKICNGETNTIRLDTLEKICVALNCTPNDILCSTDPGLQKLLCKAYNESL